MLDLPLVPAPLSGECSRPVSHPTRPRTLRSLGLAALLLSAAACTPDKPAVSPGGGTGPAPSASASASAGPAAPDPYAVSGPFTEEAFPTVETAPLASGALVLGAAPAGVSAPPALCAELLKHKTTETPSCADRATALAALDRALENATPASFETSDVSEAAVRLRDLSLTALEGCAGLPAGLARALRAEMAPEVCGDVLAAQYLESPPKEMRADVHEALYGLALAARFRRAGGAAPALAAPYTRARVEAHIKGPLAKWMKDVAGAVQALSASASKLHFYGGAVAAVGAGVADLRLVDTVRNAPIPEEFQKDEERKNVYFASLDEQLEPRKTRGRDAALVGLKRFAEVGAISDLRVQEARHLLSKLYGGRRVDALDRLILPDAPARAPGSVEERLAQKLPTFYAGILLDAKVAGGAGAAALLAAKGLPLAHRQALREGAPSAEIAPLVARAYLALGRAYWRASDFESAAKALGAVPAEGRTPELKLLTALALGLRGGPADVVEMMLKSPLGMNALGQRSALDALAAEGGPLSGAAAFDGAYLMEITAPERADGPFFKSLAKRYQTAAAALTDARQKTEAEERARAALAIAGEIK